MKSAIVNLVHLSLLLFLSSLIMFLTVSAQTGETNSMDVEGLALLVNTFPSLKVYSEGDPCKAYSWVKCSSDDTPRVTAINLGYMPSVIQGAVELPDFSAMDLYLTGNYNLILLDFPDFVANFPKLKVLYLAGISLSGTVPTSLKKRSDNQMLTLMLPTLIINWCYSDEDECPNETDGGTSTTSSTPTPLKKSRKKKTVSIVLGTIIPIFAIFWAIVGFLAINHQKRKAAAAAGQMNETPGSGTPTNADTMSPNIPSLPGVNYQDPGIAAQNIMPDDHQEVNIDEQIHPAVQA
ncbi:hypothetical protein MKW92_017700 [Papaver armeniacum]|nr:hypothetical protein MKW92_017700 [Papaver armeniacum]